MSTCEYCDIDECCTQCWYQVDIVKHPWNSGDLKGSISDVLFKGCAVRLITEGMRQVIASSVGREHGSCEMFKKKIEG